MIWKNPAEILPEPLTAVLIAVRGETEAQEGFRVRKDRWRFSDGHDAASDAVYAWAALPLCPPEQTTLKPLRSRSVKGRP